MIGDVKTHVMFCDITHDMSCYITHMLCYITRYVLLHNT